MTKRGFDKCEELKRECGSQFLQYLGKLALASGLAENELKVKIFKDELLMHKKCAGCEMPSGSGRILEYCKGGCRQVVKCDWNFCQGNEDVHACANCGKKGWCLQVGQVYYCKQCNGVICPDPNCHSECCECDDEYCKKCAGETMPYKRRVEKSDDGEDIIEPLCSLHKQEAEQADENMLTCEKCVKEGKEGRASNVCLDFRCNLRICLHNGDRYCSKHAADHKK